MKKLLAEFNIDTIDGFSDSHQNYDFMFVDEIQDVKLEKIKNILARSQKLFVAGDPDQSIYLRRVDVNETSKILENPKKYILRDINRLSQTTFRLANSVLAEADIVKGATVKDEGKKARIESELL